MDRSMIPAGTRYAIQTMETPTRTAFFGSLDEVLGCMVAMDIAFDCYVMRLSDDKLVWPIQAPGGLA